MPKRGSGSRVKKIRNTLIELTIVYDESLKKQWSQKFDNRWLGPYVVIEAHPNGSYSLKELDRMPLKTQIAGKRVKLFKQRVSRAEIYTEMRSENNMDEEEDAEESQDEDNQQHLSRSSNSHF